MPASRLLRSVLCLCALGWAAVGYGQLRIVDYNLGEWTAARAEATESDPLKGEGHLSDVLQAIGLQSVGGIAKAPDVFALQEQTSPSTTTQAVLDVLNGLYGAGTYARGNLVTGSTGAGQPGIIYRTSTVQLLEESATGTTSSTGAARQGARYLLRPAGYDATANFYLYVNHYKSDTGSTNEARRTVEAAGVRANADALGDGTHVIYAGDFNIYDSSEDAYQTLLAAGNGQALDPINSPSNWSSSGTVTDPNILRIHTQSPVSASNERYPLQVGGGMDNRFDFQLVTGEFLDNEGLSYIGDRSYANDSSGGVVESYRVFGNNGTHICCNSDINTGTGASPLVLNALMNTTDHLPVIADYQLRGDAGHFGGDSAAG